MVTIDACASLGMVKVEVDQTLEQIESSIRLVADDYSDQTALQTSSDLVRQLSGIFRLIGLQGATELLEELVTVVDILRERLASGDDAQIEGPMTVLGKSIIVMKRYLEYAHAKKKLMPVLLVGTINEARRITGKTILAESDYFEINVNVQRDYGYSGANSDHEELAKSSRRLRQMFQVGLLGVLKEKDISRLKLVKRSLERIDRLSGECKMGLFWWVAQGVVESFMSEKVELDQHRLVVLGRIDRQIKKLVYEGIDVLDEVPPEKLMRDCLYIVSLAPSTTGLIGEVKRAFLMIDLVSDLSLQNEVGLMNGPGDAVIKSVSKALREELSQIEDRLDLGARGVSLEPGFFEGIAEDLKRIADTLLMLGLVDACKQVKQQADKVSQWAEADVDTGSEAYQAVADSLLIAESGINQLLTSQRSRSGQIDQSGSVCQVSLTLLDEANQIVVTEARSGLALTKRSIASYIETQFDGMHLQNVPTTLASVWGGVYFLELERAAKVVRACERFIGKNLVVEDEEFKPKENDLETLADAITSIDYYLEGIEEQKPIGESVLELAEESIAELSTSLEAG